MSRPFPLIGYVFAFILAMAALYAGAMWFLEAGA